jgi:hypothetical protein
LQVCLIFFGAHHNIACYRSVFLYGSIASNVIVCAGKLVFIKSMLYAMLFYFSFLLNDLPSRV